MIATHPILAASAAIDDVLKTVADTDPTFMTTADKATAIRTLARLESRLVELWLRVMATAADVADAGAARDIAAWTTTATHTRAPDTRADLRLAHALDDRYPTLAQALRDGTANIVQAHVVVHALDQLLAEVPGEVPGDVLARAEDTLVGHCADFGPRELTRLAHRILEVVAPDLVDAADARALARLEAAAHRATRLSLHALGDGTTRVTGLVPDATATRLRTYLEAFTNPRRDDDTSGPPGRRSYPRRLGQAFCQFLETLDPTRLPLHGGDATTVVVTLPLTALRADLATADLLRDHTSITAAEARRLACTAGLVPAVLATDSEVLDLGRTSRLFTRAQRRALLLRDHHCRAEHCDIPGTWCEAHHHDPWSRGGRTDLADGVLLCSHHHHRAHDPTWTTERLPDGDVRYHRRR